MNRLYVVDTPENRALVQVVAECAGVTVTTIGPYVEIASDDDIVIDRRATGMRHATWYSSVAGLGDARISQWDKDALRVVRR